MRRASIYFFYDKDGVVDRYVQYYLEQVKTVADYSVVVVNGKITPEGRALLADLADDFFVRDNIGMSAWGFKSGLEYIGWEELATYDELIYASATIFGPLRPYAEIFREMEQVPCDYWGAHRVYENHTVKGVLGVNYPWGCKPECLASCHYVFRSQILHSYEFRHFWETLRPIRSYAEDIVYCEMDFGYHMTDAGFTFVSLDGDKMGKRYPSPTISGVYDSLVEHNEPFIRRKAFCDPNGDVFNYGMMVPRKALDYIARNTDYDIDMIWENLIRTYNMYELKKWLSLEKILPNDRFTGKARSATRIAVIVYVYYEELFETCASYINHFPTGTHICILSDSEEKLRHMRDSGLLDRYDTEYIQTVNRGRDVSALLIGGRDTVLSGQYDLICFMHDKKGVQTELQCIGAQYGEYCYECVASSEEYVQNVVDLFDTNPRLGLAIPPAPAHANYYVAVDGTWGNQENLAKTREVLDKLNMTKIAVDPKFPPVAPYGSVFWFRTVAIQSLFSYPWKYEDFQEEPCGTDGELMHAIERVYPFVAQNSGFYTSIILEQRYAETYLNFMSYEVRRYRDVCMVAVGRGHSMTSKQQRDRLRSQISSLSARQGRPVSLQRAHKPLIKRMVKAILPSSIWNLLRRMKCRYYGWVYVE